MFYFVLIVTCDVKARVFCNRSSALTLEIATPEPGLLRLSVRDRGTVTAGTTSTEFYFWIDDLLEKLLYGVFYLSLESAQISISALLNIVAV